MQIFINIDQSSKYILKIFDLEGRLVKTIAETYPGGFAIFEWRSKNERNAKVQVGIYLLYSETIDKNGKSTRQIEPLVLDTK